MRALCRQICDVLLEAQLDEVAECDRGLHGLVAGQRVGLLHDDAVLQHKGIRVDRVVAIDQDRLRDRRARSDRSGRRS